MTDVAVAIEEGWICSDATAHKSPVAADPLSLVEYGTRIMNSFQLSFLKTNKKRENKYEQDNEKQRIKQTIKNKRV